MKVLDILAFVDSSKVLRRYPKPVSGVISNKRHILDALLQRKYIKQRENEEDILVP